MNKKLVNKKLVLTISLLFIVIGGGFVIYFIQKKASSVVKDGAYIGPNTDGYEYLGNNKILQEISPYAHRYDVDEKESLKYWDVYNKINKNYTYNMPSVDKIFVEDNDNYILFKLNYIELDVY